MCEGLWRCVHAGPMEDIRRVPETGCARARRRHSRQLLAGLDLPTPFDVDVFVERVGRARGRPIHLVPVNGAMAGGSPCGWWCPTRDFDVIFLDDAATAMHREHIVLHEVGHMLWGHTPTLADAAPVLQHATSHLRWDSDSMRTMLGRSDYASAREQEAEVFATVAGVRIMRARGLAPGDGQGPVRRLSEALYPRGAP